MDAEQQIQIILRQTDYTEDVAKTKLQEHNDDHMSVIRSYLGIAEKKAPVRVKSVNQEIYKQLRQQMHGSGVDRK
jgi:hypothetical protein